MYARKWPLPVYCICTLSSVTETIGGDCCGGGGGGGTGPPNGDVGGDEKSYWLDGTHDQ
jgi:hypothetical protein